MSVASRVANEVGCELGSQVGYAVRFDHCSSSQTRIKFVTDGMLIRETMLDPLLTEYVCRYLACFRSSGCAFAVLNCLFVCGIAGIR